MKQFINDLSSLVFLIYIYPNSMNMSTFDVIKECLAYKKKILTFFIFKNDTYIDNVLSQV